VPSLDPYIVDVLMRDLTGHDRQPSAFLVYLFLWHRAGANRGRPVRASHKTMADATGLSKSAVQAAVRTLSRRRLIQSHRAAPTAVPEYVVNRPWRRTKTRASKGSS
jgi:DNA-binding MarR family transcriptional regulator